tara:strand:- start:353 stop:577 length:225 start_codon:yes stop_codon:yes gene_type:complete
MHNKHEATLASINFKLNSYGQIITEINSVKDTDLKEVLDKWNTSYENTHQLCSFAKWAKAYMDMFSKDAKNMLG